MSTASDPTTPLRTCPQTKSALLDLISHILVLSPFILFGLAIVLSLLTLSSDLWPAMLLYMAFIAQDAAPSAGGRKLSTPTIVSMRMWMIDNCAVYFPWRLVKCAPLDAEAGPYLFACHPHGLWGLNIYLFFFGQIG
ncbi:hypothetical protein HK096_006169 [Nowakowskiella sp. JEL0078]|nr:hypothetical protein HK096_006169 [Nowakowskiella sp. JEL0078]